MTMGILYKPDHIKFMTKEARRISEGLYQLIYNYQQDVVFDIMPLENAARRCTVGKYLAMAQRWIKVPKTKSYEDWVRGLSNYGVYFEKFGVNTNNKGISTLYKDRDEEEILWNVSGYLYELCSMNMIQDWSSYEEMNMIINWSKIYHVNQVKKAMEIAVGMGIINIKYINGILERDRVTNEFKFNREKEQIDSSVGTGTIRKQEQIDKDRDEEITRKAKEDYQNLREKQELDRIFMNASIGYEGDE
jgi:hypothetical protein